MQAMQPKVQRAVNQLQGVRKPVDKIVSERDYTQFIIKTRDQQQLSFTTFLYDVITQEHKTGLLSWFSVFTIERLSIIMPDCYRSCKINRQADKWENVYIFYHVFNLQKLNIRIIKQ